MGVFTAKPNQTVSRSTSKCVAAFASMVSIFAMTPAWSDAVILRCSADMVSENFEGRKIPETSSRTLSLTLTIDSSLINNGHNQRSIRAVEKQLLFSITVDSDAGPERTYSFDRSDLNQWFIGITESQATHTRTQFVKVQRGSGYFVYGNNITDNAGNTLNTVHIQGNCLD